MKILIIINYRGYEYPLEVDTTVTIFNIKERILFREEDDYSTNDDSDYVDPIYESGFSDSDSEDDENQWDYDQDSDGNFYYASDIEASEEEDFIREHLEWIYNHDIYHDEERLENNNTLSYYNIQNGYTLNLVYRMM